MSFLLSTLIKKAEKLEIGNCVKLSYLMYIYIYIYVIKSVESNTGAVDTEEAMERKSEETLV